MTQQEIYNQCTAKVDVSSQGITVSVANRSIVYPGQFDLTIHQGKTFSLKLDIQDESQKTLDFHDGYTAKLKIKEHPDSTDEIDSLTELDGITLGGTDNNAPNVTILRDETATAEYDFTQGVYDLEIKNTSTGEVSRYLWGFVRLRREVATS